MNFLSILKYSLILFVAGVSMSAAYTVLWGEDLASQSSLDFLFYQYLPINLVCLLVLSYYAKVQVRYTIFHLIAAVSISDLLGVIITSILMGEWFVSPLWVIDFPVTVITIGVAMIIGRSLRKEPIASYKVNAEN
ncbi:hypothetical protein ONV78_28155 [Hahella sp. CR1]|uniref:hypothetical protein n=1 Tax=Hahella sp. CR1 TaxID=2992807 RepID=UPI0024423EEC|nr:hypothetical protein [Hahella sp. CR1]MDG9671642.1 hypothetical protein [Hahella sp. CR1]